MAGAPLNLFENSFQKLLYEVFCQLVSRPPRLRDIFPLLLLLQEARSQFRILLSDSSRRLDGLSRDLGPTAVDKSRSYYEARMTARTALIEAQHAAAR